MQKSKTKIIMSAMTSVCTVCSPAYIFAMDGEKATNSDIMRLQKSSSFNLSDLGSLSVRDVATKIKQENIIFSKEKSHRLFANASEHTMFSTKFFENKKITFIDGGKRLDEIFKLIEQDYMVSRENKEKFYNVVVYNILKELFLRYFENGYKNTYTDPKNNRTYVITPELYFFDEEYGIITKILKYNKDYNFIDNLLLLLFNLDLKAKELGVKEKIRYNIDHCNPQVIFSKGNGDENFIELLRSINFVVMSLLTSVEYNGLGCANRLKDQFPTINLAYKRYINSLSSQVKNINNTLEQIKRDMATNAVNKYCKKYLSDKDTEFIDHCKRTHIRICCEFLNLSSPVDIYEEYCKENESISNLLDCLIEENKLMSFSKHIVLRQNRVYKDKKE